MNTDLQGINILLGVTGGIAAYKSAELVRLLVKSGAHVQVIMSEAACRFIPPLTLETLSGRPVPVEMFGRTAVPLEHIDLPDAADLMVIAPATADFLARCRAGRASDLISSVTLAFDGPVLAAPAMNVNMWQNPATRENVDVLRRRNHWQFVEPESGELACGWNGKGRMAPLEEILHAVASLFSRDLTGRRILVTAGPTVEDIDPVRFISNRSSGKMGYALARAAALRGAAVDLVTGPVTIDPPAFVNTVPVRSALEMNKVVQELAQNADCVVMAAAVADYRPAHAHGEKWKKAGGPVQLALVENPDILAGLGRIYADSDRPLRIGFALETEDPIPFAKEKLKSKNAHFIVANRADQSLEQDTAAVTILGRDGVVLETGPLDKRDLANRIWDLVAGHLPPADKDIP